MRTATLAHSSTTDRHAVERLRFDRAAIASPKSTN
jgi:hypothetical protein